MASDNIRETFAALRADGFMCDPQNCNHCKGEAMSDDEIEETIRERGKSDGKAAGSWVIDGNTSPERAREIFEGIENGDPAILDELPELRLGEWADDPSWDEILDDLEIECESDEEKDDLFRVYQDAWSEGMSDEVQRAARLAMPIKVKITCSDDDDGMCTLWCDDVEQARHDQSVSLDGQSSNWEFPDGEIAICSLSNFYDLEAALEAAGYDVDGSEYSAPDDEDLKYWAYRSECECAGEDPLDRDAWYIATHQPE